MMKVAIGYRVKEGPWGGGNRIIRALTDELVRIGHNVVYNLVDKDIDIILMTDPRSRIANISFAAGEIIRYLLFTNPNAIVIHRVNECDERKNTKTMNFRLKIANYCADHTVFVGSWLARLETWKKKSPSEYTVILNGANKSVFNPEGHEPWDRSRPLRLVTHHWAGNWMKGFDVYQYLDELLGETGWRKQIDFTYIGNLPKHFKFRNANHISPLDSQALADELRRHDVYITASLNEPGSNHQNEAAMCGLPLIYRNSGCLPEYCHGYGISFDGIADVAGALSRMMDNYEDWHQRIHDFPLDIEKTVSEYIALFEDLLEKRHEIVSQRNLWRNPSALIFNQIPV